MPPVPQKYRRKSKHKYQSKTLAKTQNLSGTKKSIKTS
jgi:hypothetical protein